MRVALQALRRGLRRHAVAAHQRLRRGARAAHRARRQDRAAHPADHRPRVRRHRHRRPVRRLLLRRGADRRDRATRASDADRPKVDELGGSVEAIEFITGEIDESAWGYQERYRTGQDIVVGVNQYVEDELDVEDLLRVDPRVRARSRSSGSRRSRPTATRQLVDARLEALRDRRGRHREPAAADPRRRCATALDRRGLRRDAGRLRQVHTDLLSAPRPLELGPAPCSPSRSTASCCPSTSGRRRGLRDVVRLSRLHAVGAPQPSGGDAGGARAERPLGKLLMTPAMVVVLLAGIYLASDADVWSEAWVSGGFVGMILLFGIAGVSTGWQRKAAQLATTSDSGLRRPRTAAQHRGRRRDGARGRGAVPDGRQAQATAFGLMHASPSQSDGLAGPPTPRPRCVAVFGAATRHPPSAVGPASARPRTRRRARAAPQPVAGADARSSGLAPAAPLRPRRRARPRSPRTSPRPRRPRRSAARSSGSPARRDRRPRAARRRPSRSPSRRSVTSSPLPAARATSSSTSARSGAGADARPRRRAARRAGPCPPRPGGRRRRSRRTSRR